MNDVSNRAVREFSEFLNSIEADFPKPTCTTAYEITMKSTIVSALITLDTEKQMDERFWNHLRVQRNILDFLYKQHSCLPFYQSYPGFHESQPHQCCPPTTV